MIDEVFSLEWSMQSAAKNPQEPEWGGGCKDLSRVPFWDEMMPKKQSRTINSSEALYSLLR